MPHFCQLSWFHIFEFESTTVKHIVSIGVHILDMLGRHVSEIPPGQHITLIDEIRVGAAGTAAGTSVDLAKLGGRVTAVGALGDDEIGNIVVGIMSRYGIETRHLRRKPGVQTSASILPIRPNGERPALHVMGANATFCFEDVPQDVIRSADFVHVGGFFMMPRFDGVDSFQTLMLARQAGAVTTMDVLGIEQPDMAAKILPCMPFLDYFMPNLEEARMISGLSDVRDLTRYFLDAGARTVILKMGARGSLLASDLGTLRVPAYQVPVVDTCGCGDGWTAGFITGLSHGWSLERSAQLGSACGSLVATGLGSDAGIVDLESTLAFMESTPTLPLGD